MKTGHLNDLFERLTFSRRFEVVTRAADGLSRHIERGEVHEIVESGCGDGSIFFTVIHIGCDRQKPRLAGSHGNHQTACQLHFDNGILVAGAKAAQR